MSIIVKIYLSLIGKGIKALDDIKDENIKNQVQQELERNITNG
jgi:hypothetical protein